MTPAPSKWPKLVAPSKAGRPNPPKRLGDGKAGPELGYLIVSLLNAIAITLQIIITIATLGLHSRVVGTVASKGYIISKFAFSTTKR